ITGWPLELMAYTRIQNTGQFEEMAAAASNKTSKDMRYPEMEEQALQFILDSCESSISKSMKFLQVRNLSHLLINVLPLTH
ncbi:hypothetical protein MKX01_038817, partial [Papaver californicum]